MKKLFSYGCKITFWDPVRAKMKVKQKARLNFSETEFRQLPKSVAEQLTEDEKDEGNYFTVPTEFDKDWESLRSDIRSRKFDCIVLSTDHKEFRETYYELISETNPPPVIDINNTIEKWLRKAELEPQSIEKIQEILEDRSRYMLYGRD